MPRRIFLAGIGAVVALLLAGPAAAQSYSGGVFSDGHRLLASDLNSLKLDVESYSSDAGNLSAGSVPCAQLPALSGDVTNLDCATTIGAHKVVLVDLAQIGANTVLGNFSGVTANVAAWSLPNCIDTAGQHMNYVAGTGWTCGNSGTLGTVSSVSLTMPAEFLVSGSPVTSSGGFVVTRVNQSANLVYAGPSTGSPASPAFRSLVGADLPNPSSGALGGVQSKAAVSHNFLTGVSTAGVVSAAQPAAADLSDGVTGSGAVVLTSSPALTNPNLNTPSAINLLNATNIQASALPANVKIRAFGTSFGDTGGSALTTGSVVYFTVPFACTISAWNMTLDAGTATVDVWKIATGTAIPTVANTITASALPAISTGTAKHSTTLTGWTTSVTANDIFGFQLQAVSTAKYVSATLECDQ